MIPTHRCVWIGLYSLTPPDFLVVFFLHFCLAHTHSPAALSAVSPLHTLVACLLQYPWVSDLANSLASCVQVYLFDSLPACVCCCSLYWITLFVPACLVCHSPTILHLVKDRCFSLCLLFCFTLVFWKNWINWTLISLSELVSSHVHLWTVFE